MPKYYCFPPEVVAKWMPFESLFDAERVLTETAPELIVLEEIGHVRRKLSVEWTDMVNREQPPPAPERKRRGRKPKVLPYIPAEGLVIEAFSMDDDRRSGTDEYYATLILADRMEPYRGQGGSKELAALDILNEADLCRADIEAAVDSEAKTRLLEALK